MPQKFKFNFLPVLEYDIGMKDDFLDRGNNPLPFSPLTSAHAYFFDFLCFNLSSR